MMESSVKAHNRVSDRSPQGQVEGALVVADHLVSSDPAFREEASLMSPAEIGRMCQDAFDLGVTARRFVNESSEVVRLADHVTRLETVFQKVTHDASEAVMKSVKDATDSENGPIADAVTRETKRLSAVVTEAFDADDKASALSRIEKLVGEVVQNLGAESEKRILKLVDPSDPDCPIGKLRAEIARETAKPISDLKDEVRNLTDALNIETAVEAERERGTAKGRTYEQEVGGYLEECALVTGDELEAVGDCAGALGNSKVGDHVSTVESTSGATVRVVFESKDRKLTLTAAKNELQKALENRQAASGVMVFSSQECSPTALPFTKVAAGQYFVVFDKEDEDPLPLRVAYQISRLDALLTLKSSAGDDLDIDELLEKLGQAHAKLDYISKVERGLNAAQKGISTSRENLSMLRDELTETLNDITDMVSDSEEE